MGGWVVWKGFEPILDKLGTVGSCLMEVGGGGDLRVSKTDYFFPSMLLETQMRTIKDDQFVMIITQGMPIPWSEVLLWWRMHNLVLCNRGWLCSAWLEKLDGGWVVGTIGIGIGIGRGGIATKIAKQSTSIGSPVLCCCISPWGRPPNWKCSQHPYFHTFLLLIPSLGRVQKKWKTFFFHYLSHFHVHS